MTGAVSQDEKTQAILCWVLSLFIGIVSPLIFYLISKEKPFTYRHAAECLTVHIVVLVGYLIAGALCVIGIGLVLMPIVWIYALVITIMGAIAASNGQPYDPPITAPWATKMFGV